MPNLELLGLKEKLVSLEQRMDETDKIARRGLHIAVVGLGVGIVAVIISLLPFVIK